MCVDLPAQPFYTYAAMHGTPDNSGYHWKRFRKVRWFFFKVLLQALWRDVILNYPLLRWPRSLTNGESSSKSFPQRYFCGKFEKADCPPPWGFIPGRK